MFLFKTHVWTELCSATSPRLLACCADFVAMNEHQGCFEIIDSESPPVNLVYMNRILVLGQPSEACEDPCLTEAHSKDEAKIKMEPRSWILQR